MQIKAVTESGVSIPFWRERNKNTSSSSPKPYNYVSANKECDFSFVVVYQRFGNSKPLDCF